MKLTLFGATGTIGRRILAEALMRGHHVTAVVRDPSRLTEKHPNLEIERGDVSDPATVAKLAAGRDAVISAVGPGHGDAKEIVDAARSLVQGLKSSPKTRLIVVGGAGSLEVAPGVQLVDAPDFPAAWKAPALAHRDALDVYRRAGGVNWTYMSPAALIEPGERTGKYRRGGDQLLVDQSGQSRISTEDYAVALLDELDRPQAIRRRFTVAY